MRWLAMLLAGLLASPAALAQMNGKGPYVGLGYGVFQIDDDGEETQIGFSDTAASYRLFGGYNIHDALAVELGFGKSAGFRESLVSVTSGDELDIDVDYDVTTLRVLALAPFSGVDMFGGLGYYSGDVKLNLHLFTAFGDFVETVEDSVSGATIIGGVQFHLDRLVIRGEYEWFDDDKGLETSALNIAIVIPFGR